MNVNLGVSYRHPDDMGLLHFLQFLQFCIGTRHPGGVMRVDGHYSYIWCEFCLSFVIYCAPYVYRWCHSLLLLSLFPLDRNACFIVREGFKKRNNYFHGISHGGVPLPPPTSRGKYPYLIYPSSVGWSLTRCSVGWWTSCSTRPCCEPIKYLSNKFHKRKWKKN